MISVPTLVFDGLLVFLSVALGSIMVLQANMNIHLGYTLGSPIRSACVSFWVSGAKGSYFQFKGIRWYHIGGLLGAFYVTSTALWIPYVGYSLFYVCLVCGQLLSALVIDWRGLLGSAKLPIHSGRLCGCALTLAGSVMVFFARSSNSEDSRSGGSGGASLFAGVSCALVSGLFLPAQAAVNNGLRRETKISTIATTGISLLVGALALSIVSSLSFLWISVAISSENNQWWHWMGGLVGWLYIAAGTQFSPIIGYSTFFVSVIAGQLILSLISDILGLLGPARGSAASLLSLAGVLSAAAGAAVVSIYKAAESKDITTSRDGPSLSYLCDEVGLSVELSSTQSPIYATDTAKAEDALAY